eukprot:TRINITY_DN5517_c0_g2_i1.p1 TRINITY_DN5517_c0_g2~~TRINITY_DN5517_c0_g2_i1.p1  ORF type:complete len:745 (+),score=240.87 TRINITY_DN5517_c0_g2_i1:170-2236(+)
MVNRDAIRDPLVEEKPAAVESEYSAEALEKLRLENNKNKMHTMLLDKQLETEESVFKNSDADEDTAMDDEGIPSKDSIELLKQERRIRAVKGDEQSFIAFDQTREGKPSSIKGVLDSIKNRGTLAQNSIGEDDDVSMYSKRPTMLDQNMSDDEEIEAKMKFEKEQLKRAKSGFISSAPDETTGVTLRGTAIDTVAPPPLRLPDFTEQMKRLQEQVERMKTQASVRAQQDGQLQQHIDVSKGLIKEYQDKVTKTQDFFHYVQGQRDFFDTLGDCFEEKMSDLKALVKKSHELRGNAHKAHLKKRMEWKAEEDAEVQKVMAGRPMQEAEDGLERDEEWQPVLNSVWEAQLSTEREALLEDVDDEYNNIVSVRDRLRKWKEEDIQSYMVVAQPSLALCYEPFVLLELVTWDIFTSTVTVLSSMQWWSALEVYQGEEDMEKSIRAFIVTEVILPFVADYIEACYDPMSAEQTQKLVAFFDEAAAVVKEPSALEKPFEAVCKAVTNGMDMCVPVKLGGGWQAVRYSADDMTDELVKGRIRTRRGVFNLARKRYAMGVRIAENALKYSDQVPDMLLGDAVVKGLCGMLAPHLSSCPMASFENITYILNIIYAELAKLPNTYYSLNMYIGHPRQQDIKARTQPISSLLEDITYVFKSMRQTLGREHHTAMIHSAKTFKLVCDTLGDDTVIRKLMG